MSINVLVRWGRLSIARHRTEKYSTSPISGKPLQSKRTQLISLKGKVPLRDETIPVGWCPMLLARVYKNTIPSNHLRHSNPGGFRYCILIAVIINSCIWLLESQTHEFAFHTNGNWNIIFYYVLTDKWLISTISISPWKWPWISVFPPSCNWIRAHTPVSTSFKQTPAQ